MLEIKNLIASHKKNNNVLKNIKLKLSNPGFASLIGESRNGKITFLKF